MRVGDLVEIVFRDHAKGNETIVFSVLGRVLRSKRDEVTVGVWVYADRKIKWDPNDPNVDTYSIARNAIISYRVFT